MGEPEPEPPRQVRRGEKFTPSEDVAFHCTDFSFEDHARELLQRATSAGPGGLQGGAPAEGPEAADAWESHYVAHSKRFYPIKNYILKAFPLLQEVLSDRAAFAYDDSPLRILECGCGTGSALLPMMNFHTDRVAAGLGCEAEFYGFDISRTAVEELRRHRIVQEVAALGIPTRYFVWDFTQALGSAGELGVLRGGVSHATLLFVLSAVHPDQMEGAVAQVGQLLRPGGVLCFRDYGIYDQAHQRFSAGQGLQDVGTTGVLDKSRMYFRGDGTRAYFFTTGDIAHIAQGAGLEVVDNAYHCAESKNHKTGAVMRKVFVNAVLRRRG